MHILPATATFVHCDESQLYTTLVLALLSSINQACQSMQRVACRMPASAAQNSKESAVHRPTTWGLGGEWRTCLYSSIQYPLGTLCSQHAYCSRLSSRYQPCSAQDSCATENKTHSCSGPSSASKNTRDAPQHTPRLPGSSLNPKHQRQHTHA